MTENNIAALVWMAVLSIWLAFCLFIAPYLWFWFRVRIGWAPLIFNESIAKKSIKDCLEVEAELMAEREKEAGREVTEEKKELFLKERAETCMRAIDSYTQNFTTGLWHHQ